jgi:uncharacterized protein YnzC (UPF0291/DUF896 family)
MKTEVRLSYFNSIYQETLHSTLDTIELIDQKSDDNIVN